eukprot:CAMPEP_0182881686 /NCGR_PEP_ID=MMETSP0034_2-20130328/17321_1 /TAXON_ID=156128 /ORGANISM="Nephroselmis pyriformis, Strain CCMP717" /LENGTH=531 /DNA_ID=CAMNT_0025014729 /DNA_START=21 /DNA_END=1616 /DNA_ORIENTATION=-
MTASTMMMLAGSAHTSTSTGTRGTVAARRSFLGPAPSAPAAGARATPRALAPALVCSGSSGRGSGRRGERATKLSAVEAGKPAAPAIDYPTVASTVGNTPLVRLQRLPGKDNSNVILCKLEGNNPAGSVKDRPALNMFAQAEADGRIRPGDTIIEATSGNTGIALAMVAAIKGYKLILIMPSNMSEERKSAMAAYGAKLIDVPPGQMEMARDLATQMQAEGKGIVLDQFANPNNPAAHYGSTGPELWRETEGTITHFVSSMGTTGTIMGTSRYLKEMNPEVQIVGLQPADGAQIAGIRRWSPEYLPSIYEDPRVDRKMDIYQGEAEEAMRALARTEGIFCGVSSGGAVSAALRLSEEVEGATICAIICDRGDRYLSTGLFGSDQQIMYPTTPAGLKQSLRRALGLRTLVIFNSDFASPGEDGEDVPDAEGAPWCPDCRKVLPVVERLVAETEGAVVLLRCDVGMRPLWKDPAHPLRTDPELAVTCIPTLMWWDHDAEAPGERLGPELEAAEGEAEVEALVRPFLALGVAKH